MSSIGYQEEQLEIRLAVAAREETTSGCTGCAYRVSIKSMQIGPQREFKNRHLSTRCSLRLKQQAKLRMLISMFSLLVLIISILSNELLLVQASDSSSTSKVSQVASKLQSSGANLVRKLDLAKSSGQLNDWLVHQVAPAMATKIIDNVLQSPGKSKKGRSNDADSSKKTIDTQALADKIVDKLADSIKKRKNSAKEQQLDSEDQMAETSSILKEEISQPVEERNNKKEGSSRKGKSLVGDSVNQMMQNLISKAENRKFFGRAMEKHKSPLRSGGNALQHGHSNSWLMVKEPTYDFVSTDSSQLDENPVVLRAEHGHNQSTTSDIQQHQNQHQQANRNSPYQSQNLSPLISTLMSSQATNQIGNKLLQQHRLQQKYVHTNRHSQQHLAPKPWPAPNQQGRRPQQQSPYSLPVTSDMNIVQAPSSPAPPPLISASPSTTTSTTTTTTTTQNPPTFSFAPPPNTVVQLGTNKFKINNRHQLPASTMSQSSWYASNSNHKHQSSGYNHGGNHRFQHHHPSTTTSTTTTTTTTPEPPPTELITETMESLNDLDQQTSSPVSSILSSVAQSALESLSQSGSMGADESSNIYNSSSSNYDNLSSSSSVLTSLSGVKGASPSTTTARHSISAEAIPTALGAPLYHLNRANFTATSFMGPPPRRSGTSPVAKMASQYIQKGLNNLSSTIFGRQNKNWARRLGLSSVLLSGLLYTAAMLANPGAPLPTTGLGVLQALTKNKRRRGSGETNILPAIDDSSRVNLLDSNNVNFLLQQPHLIPIIEQLIRQEQEQHQNQNSLFSQRSFSANPIEIEGFDADTASRRSSPSQMYTIRALPNGIARRRR